MFGQTWSFLWQTFAPKTIIRSVGRQRTEQVCKNKLHQKNADQQCGPSLGFTDMIYIYIHIQIYIYIYIYIFMSLMSYIFKYRLYIKLHTEIVRSKTIVWVKPGLYEEFEPDRILTHVKTANFRLQTPSD